MIARGTVREALCAVEPEHEDLVATALAAGPAALRLVRRCGDLVELLALVESGTGDVVLVSTSRAPGDRLDRDVVARLRARDVVVVLLVPGLDVAAAERAWGMGADLVLPTDAVDDALGARLLAAGPRDAAEPLAPAPTDGAPTEALDAADPRRAPGRLVVVWGPHGSPGRTTVALNVAAELAAHRPRQIGREVPRVLLVDADTHAPSLAQHLAMLDESSGLALAARAAGQGRLDPAALAALAPTVGPQLHVLTGLGRAARWPEVPGPALDALWDAARDLADVTVVDCAAPLEHDEALSYDTRAPQRNAATLSALHAADTLVVVGGADPVAVQRLVHALADLADVPGITRDRVVVLNRARASVAGGRPTSVLGDALARFAGVRPDLLLPDEGPTLDAALLAGGPLAEHAPASAVRRGLAELAERLLAQQHAAVEEHRAALARHAVARAVPAGG